MPAQHTFHVAVIQPLLQFVNEQIAFGRCATVSKLVREALRLLMDTSKTVQNSTLLGNADV